MIYQNSKFFEIEGELNTPKVLFVSTGLTRFLGPFQVNYYNPFSIQMETKISVSFGLK